MLRNSRAVTVLRHERLKLVHSFTLLQNAPFDLWLVFVLKWLESYAHFSIAQVITLFLTEEYGMTDSEAGITYGIYGATISLYGVIFSQFVDELGVKYSLLIGMLLAFVARLSLTIAHSFWSLYLTICLLLPLSAALGVPVMLIAVRRLTDESNRGFALSLLYAMMNLGAFCSGPMIDLATAFLDFPEKGLSANRSVMLLCTIASGLSIVVCVKGIKHPRLLESRYLGISSAEDEATRDDISEGVEKRAEGFCTLIKDPTFKRFFVFSMLMVNLRCIFRHLDATMPKYLIRLHGEDVKRGLIYAINPMVIIFTVAPITAMTAKHDAFRIIKIGGFISALSPIYMVFSNSILAAVAFVLQLSIGEGLWSPRFLDYQISIAPEGKEAIFMALASAPLYLAKVPSGFQSGYLLQRYLPAPDACSDENDVPIPDCVLPERRPGLLWFIILVSTVISPILIHLFENRLREPDVNIKYKRVRTRHDSDMSDIFEGVEVVEQNS